MKEDDMNIRTPFDNDVSMAYKYAKKMNLPSEYVIKLEGDEYVTYPDIIKGWVEKGNSLSDIYDSLNEYGYLNPNDVALIYARIKMKEGIDIDSLLEELNEFHDNYDTKEKFADKTDLNNAINGWKRMVNELIRTNLRNVENIENIHTILSKVDNHMKITHLVVNSMTISAYPLFIENGIRAIEDVFDKAKVSKDLPYVQYNTPENNLIKLYKGDSIDNTIDYEAIIHKKTEVTDLYKLYFTMWVGNEDNIMNANKKEMSKGYYDTETQILKLDTIIKEKSGLSLEDVLNKMAHLLNIEEYENTETLHIKGIFMVLGVEINDYAFIHMVMNDAILSEYFFVDETVISYAEKKRISLRYKSTYSNNKKAIADNYLPSSLNITINQYKTNESGKWLVHDPVSNEDEEVNVNSGTPYLEIKISRASSMEDIENFMNIFTYLLSYYKQHERKIIQFYQKYIPELKEEKPVKQKEDEKIENNIQEVKPVKQKRTGDKLSTLVQRAPDLFITSGYPGYSRTCQKKYQPTIIEKEEVEEWENKGYQVMPFPKEDPKYYFVCEYSDYKHPGAAKNPPKNSNYAKYPCVPCCYKADHIKNKKSVYNNCKNTEKPQVATKPQIFEIKGDKALDMGGLGLVSNDCAKLISLLTNNDKNSVKRYGVPFSNNSIFHSLLIATQDDDYIKLKTDKDRENYVKEYRSSIKNIEDINISLLKQEFYDYKEDDIWKFINDVDSFFDARWYYRLLEELFGVNIYVFTKVSENETKFEIPNFRIFPVRIYRKLPVVCLYKVEGISTQLISFPQYELLCVTKESENPKFIFSNKYSKNFYDAYINCVKVISYVGENNYLLNNMYNIDLSKYTKNKQTSQIIDTYGKMRGLIFNISDNEQATIFSLPTQPINLPSTRSIKLASVKTVINILGMPKTVTRDAVNKIEGLWYDLEQKDKEVIKEAIFIPVKPNNLKILGEIPEGKANPYITKGKDIIAKNIKLKRDLEFVYQLTEWLFTFNPDFDDFVQKYITYPNKNGEKIDSLTIYNFEKLSPFLPDVNTIDEAIVYISENTEGFIKNKKIYLYTEKFAKGVLYHIKMFIKSNMGFNWENVRMSRIRHSVTVPEDFNVTENVALFFNYNEMESWLETKSSLSSEKLSVVNNIIDANIGGKLINRVDPYMYQTLDTGYYIIQNVKDNDISRALNVSINWILNDINLGYNVSPLDSIDDINYIIYEASTTGEFIVLDDKSQNQENPYKILNYEKNKYAAILTLPDIKMTEKK